MKCMRAILAAGLLLALAACGGAPESPALAPLPKLETITVAAGGSAAGRAWDGVVEAVQQADLSAQTSGRVDPVAVDVNDRVAEGQVLMRLTAVEQQAGANAARAQLRAAEAAGGGGGSHLRALSGAGGRSSSSRACSSTRRARRATRAVAGA